MDPAASALLGMGLAAAGFAGTGVVSVHFRQADRSSCHAAGSRGPSRQIHVIGSLWSKRSGFTHW